jgi:hypothetical protein
MKRFGAAFVVLICVALIGCGANSSNKSNINGAWNATLTSGGNSTVFAFGTSLRQNSDGSLSVTNFKFTTNSPCFVSGETETGSFAVSGDFDGNVNGTFGMNVQSGDPIGNTLALNGTANGNNISGKWTLTGSGGCKGNGTFSMTKM